MSEAKKKVSEHYKLPHPYILESWMYSIGDVRNICAHHGRLWNRIIKKIKVPDKTGGFWLEDLGFYPTCP